MRELYSEIPSPCFVLEESLLIKNLSLLKKIVDTADVKIILALKGFAMHSVFDSIKNYLPGSTASSINEAKLANEFFGGEIHGYSPVYIEEEFEDWLHCCQHLTFNSLNQWEKYRLKVKDHPVSCGIRINPEYSEVTTDLYNPCVSGSRLGMRANQLPKELPKGIEGLHFHSLCENDSYTLEKTWESVKQKFGNYLPHLKWLNLGGGHAITRKDYNVEHLISLLKTIKNEYPNLEIILEPGSAIAWETGFLKTTVEDIFESDGIQSAIIDASFSAHMPDCIEMPYTPAIRNARIAKENEKRTRIGGTSCLAGDFVGDYYFEKPLKIGDSLFFEDMMHYTMVKTTFFNGVKHPSIGIIRENGQFELIKEFGYDSFRDKLS